MVWACPWSGTAVVNQALALGAGLGPTGLHPHACALRLPAPSPRLGAVT